jgi:hypothetical protein
LSLKNVQSLAYTQLLCGNKNAKWQYKKNLIQCLPLSSRNSPIFFLSADSVSKVPRKK